MTPIDQLTQDLANAQAEIAIYRDALQCVLKHHTEPAGFTLELLENKEKFSEFIDVCGESSDLMIAKVKQALSQSSPSLALQEYRDKLRAEFIRELEVTYIVGRGWQCDEMPPFETKLYALPNDK